MKNTTTLLMMALGLSVWTVAVRDPSPVVSRQVMAAEMKATEMVEGVVMTAGNSRLLVTPMAGDITEFIVSPTARIVRDGQATNLDSLQPRDHVLVMSASEAQEKVAVDIVARSPL